MDLYRGDVWMLISGAWNSKPEKGYYGQLLIRNKDNYNPFAEEIEKDVRRSLPEHYAYQSQKGKDDDVFVTILKGFFVRLGSPAVDELDVRLMAGNHLFKLLLGTACDILGPYITNETIESLRCSLGLMLYTKSSLIKCIYLLCLLHKDRIIYRIDDFLH
jgi:hypothetical protein